MDRSHPHGAQPRHSLDFHDDVRPYRASRTLGEASCFCFAKFKRKLADLPNLFRLGFIHSQTKLFQSGGARAGRSIHEDLIVHALARVLLHGYIPNIQVSWVKLGFEQSLACLEAGANDFGGTLMEESISKAAGANFGEYVSPGEFRAMIRTIGRIPAERSTTYEIRKVFEHPDAEERLPLEPMPVFGSRQITRR